MKYLLILLVFTACAKEYSMEKPCGVIISTIYHRGIVVKYPDSTVFRADTGSVNDKYCK